MKSKQLIRFYFSADSLNRALDNLITTSALKSMECYTDVDGYTEKICGIVYEKQRLNILWKYLDKVMSDFTENEKNVLRYYGTLRTGTTCLSSECRREIKRVTVKFTRRMRMTDSYGEEIAILGKYYCIM